MKIYKQKIPVPSKPEGHRDSPKRAVIPLCFAHFSQKEPRQGVLVSAQTLCIFMRLFYRKNGCLSRYLWNKPDKIVTTPYKHINQAPQKINAIIHDDSLENAECFMKIEKIVCTLESIGSSGGSRHDFGQLRLRPGMGNGKCTHTPPGGWRLDGFESVVYQ